MTTLVTVRCTCKLLELLYSITVSQYCILINLDQHVWACFWLQATINTVIGVLKVMSFADILLCPFGVRIREVRLYFANENQNQQLLKNIQK